jgi:predicted patatin/cPLA2 family phospholipase
MRERHARYNACLDRLGSLERSGRAFVFRPVKSLVVGRMEREVAKLDALYRQGYEEALERLPELITWLAAPDPRAPSVE